MNDSDLDLGKVSAGAIVEGFRVDAVYLDGAGKFVGGQFRNLHTGFLVDAIGIQTAPQAVLWVNTVPTSDMGEAHTQEHLLLGKGNKGRRVAGEETFSLSHSSAGTGQWRTIYHFNTVAGADVFFDQMRSRLDALLHPDYTDLEVEREVRNFGVTTDSVTGRLKIEEKGTVYNEMLGTVQAPNWKIWRAAMREVYGTGHPLALESGGTPEGLRLITAADIKTFHDRNYVLSNMGAIAVFPKSLPLTVLLKRLNEMLTELQPSPVSPSELTGKTEPRFPTPKCNLDRSVKIVSYPGENAQKPGQIMLNWPATRRLNSQNQQLMEIFLSCVAGDSLSPLYKKFVDRKTRIVDFGAAGVGLSLNADQGFPVTFHMSNVEQSHINEKDIEFVRAEVLATLKEIASWLDGSPKLRAFNQQIRDRLLETRRYLNKNLSTPPGFGTRGLSSFWNDLLLQLQRSGRFSRSLVFAEDNDFVEKQVQDLDKNVWSAHIKEWGLLDEVPFALGNRPDPELTKKNEADRVERINKELIRLKEKYKVDDEQAALTAYERDYDAQSKQLEALAESAPKATLVANLPMNQDPDIEYERKVLRNKVPITSSYFDNMTGTFTGIAFDLRGIEPDDLLYLSMLPGLLSSIGVIEDGKPVTHDQMVERLAREVYRIGAQIDADHWTGRTELVVSGSGTNESESKRALAWMDLIMQSPYLREENLPRIQEVIDHHLAGLRAIRQSPYEEHWEANPALTYMCQDDPLILNTDSFLTKTHNAQRLKWRLKGNVDSATVTAVSGFLSSFASSISSCKRDDLSALFELLQNESAVLKKDSNLNKDLLQLVKEIKGLSPESLKLAREAVHDLSQNLDDIPDPCLISDLQAMVAEISEDFHVEPADTLARLDSVRKKILNSNSARMYEVGSRANLANNVSHINSLLSKLADSPFKPALYNKERYINSRLKQHDSSASEPRYVGLVNANTHQGIFQNYSPAIKYSDLSDDSISKYLAFDLIAGGGATSLFMKTWGAGLAYGNGSSATPNRAMFWCADKVPDLPVTLRFVIEQVKGTKLQPELTDYAIAQQFSSRAAQSYESRGVGIDYDFLSGRSPETIRNFREAILRVRKLPDLAQKLFALIPGEYAKVLPGMDAAAPVPDGSIYFVIGDDRQFASYEKYLKSAIGGDTILHRLYGRDYWTNLGSLPER